MGTVDSGTCTSLPLHPIAGTQTCELTFVRALTDPNRPGLESAA
jgi:hypothetical protein